MTVGNCEDCAFWARLSPDEPEGHCYLHPPRLIPGAEVCSNGQPRDSFELTPEDFYRPVTYEGDLCGSFQEKG